MNFSRSVQMRNITNSSRSGRSSSSSNSSSNSIDTPKNVNYRVTLRYCGIKELFRVPQKSGNGQNIAIKREKTITISKPENTSKEDIIKMINTDLQNNQLYDVGAGYTIDLNRTEELGPDECSGSLCLILYLNGPNDTECQSSDTKYYTAEEVNLIIYNENRTIPSDAILTDINSLNPNKKYLIITNPPDNNIPELPNKPLFSIKLEEYSRPVDFQNAIGIFKKQLQPGFFKFEQISPVNFNGTNIIRENIGGKIVPGKTYDGYIYVPTDPIYKNYIKFYELPPSYDNLFKKSFFEKTSSFFKNPAGGKIKTNRRHNRKTNRRNNKRTKRTK